MPITTILFDLGGVLYPIDDSLTVRAFTDLGVADFDKVYSLKKQNPFIDKFERGQIDDSQFIDGLQPHFTSVVNEADVIAAWNAMLLGFSKDNLEVLSTLRDRYRVLLLSNTNSIHIEYIENQLLKDHGVEGLSSLFDKTYLSYTMGERKPDKAIYQKVLEEEGLDPKEILFLDDNAKNIEGAKSVGIDARIFVRNSNLREYVYAQNLLPKLAQA